MTRLIALAAAAMLVVASLASFVAFSGAAAEDAKAKGSCAADVCTFVIF